MFLSEILGSLQRRWILSLVVMATAMGLGAGLAFVNGPQYELRSEAVLLPPKTTLPGGANPYLNIATITAAVDVLSLALVDDNTMTALQKKGLDAEVTVQRDVLSPAPLLLIDVTASSPEKARTANYLLLSQAPITLASLQQSGGIGSAAQISLQVVTKGVTPTVVRKQQFRLGLASGVGLLALGLFGVGAADVFVARRRGQQRVRGAHSPTFQPRRRRDLKGRNGERASSSGFDGAEESIGLDRAEDVSRSETAPQDASDIPAELVNASQRP